MDTTEILRGWKTILSGRTPFLSIEITKECPLSCPGCYAYGDEHLGGAATLRQVSDFSGFTTFSSFGIQAFTFLQTGEVMRAGLYVLVSNVGGLLMVWAGY